MCFLGTLIHCKFLTISACRFGIFAVIIQKLWQENVRINLQKTFDINYPDQKLLCITNLIRPDIRGLTLERF